MSPELDRPPRELAEALNLHRALPEDGGERFVGYGVYSLPFRSGDVLAFRRVARSTVGPPFTSVWHRGPEGRWTFYVDIEPNRSCPRYFGAAIERVVVGGIELTWTGPATVGLHVPERRLHWGLRMQATAVTRALDVFGGLLPDRLWERPAVLSGLGSIAGRALGAGRLRLSGRSPNGQEYRLHPERTWIVEGSAAVVEGRELGPTGALEVQPRIGGFLLPNRGIFVLGSGYQESFDPMRHEAEVSRNGVVRSGR